MGKNEHGKDFVQRIVLDPHILFSGPRRPTPAEITAIHERSHADCFIANSVKTEITVSPDS
jgi:organic hydroperoxide reductase OsmC/OhrA